MNDKHNLIGGPGHPLPPTREELAATQDFQSPNPQGYRRKHDPVQIRSDIVNEAQAELARHVPSGRLALSSHYYHDWIVRVVDNAFSAGCEFGLRNKG